DAFVQGRGCLMRSPTSEGRDEEPTADEAIDTAASTLHLLERRTTVSLLSLLFALAALAWWLDLRIGRDDAVGFMPAMDLREAALFCPTWVVMSMAMMLPTIFPIVLVQRFVAESRQEGWATTAALILGYLAIWLLSSLVALALVSVVAMILMNRP